MDSFYRTARRPDCVLAVDAMHGGSWWSAGRPDGVDTDIYGMLYNPHPNLSLATMSVAKVAYDERTNTLYLVKDHQSLPAHRFRRCVMDDLAARHVNYYLGESDSNFKEDGTPSILTGEDGDVMVEIPVVYWRVETFSDGRILYLVSRREFEGSEIHPYFYVSPGGATARTQYAGACQAALCDADGVPLVTDINATTQPAYSAANQIRSVAGAKPAVSTALERFRILANNRGGQAANSLFRQFLRLMMFIEGGTLDSQTAFSPGFSYAKRYDYRYTRLSGRSAGFGNGTGSVYANPVADANIAFASLVVNGATYYRNSLADANGYFGWTNAAGTLTYYTAAAAPANGSTSYSDAAGTASGYTTSGYSAATPEQQVAAFSYRGIENPFGEVFEVEEGIVVDTLNGLYYWTADLDQYSGTDYPATYQQVPHAWPKSNGYPQTWDPKTFFPLTLGGSATTYLCDRFLAGNNSARACFVGGALNGISDNGIGYFHVSGGVVSSDVSIGCRISC